jgi:hypothetical protein
MVFYPERGDFQLAYEIQEKLYERGKMKGFADLLISAVCIRKDEFLITKDSDFNDIADISDLRMELM